MRTHAYRFARTEKRVEETVFVRDGIALVT